MRERFVFRIAMRLAREFGSYYQRSLPRDEKRVYSPEDMAHELFVHWLVKWRKGKYDPLKGKVDKWTSTIMCNKAKSIIHNRCRILGIGREVKPLPEILLRRKNYQIVVDNRLISGIVECVSSIEMTIEREQSESLDKFVELFETMKIYSDEIQGYCESFGVEFDAENLDTTLDSVLDAMSESSDDAWNSLELKTQKRIEKIVAAFDSDEEEAYTIVRRGMGHGRGRRSPNGPVAKIRELFNEGKGITNARDMIKEFQTNEELEDLSPATTTIRTQVGKLRAEFGLASPRAKGAGIVKMVKKLFNEGQGIVSYDGMISAMNSWGNENEVEFSEATIRTQVGKLRAEYRDKLPRPGRPVRRGKMEGASKITSKVAKKTASKSAVRKVVTKKSTTGRKRKVVQTEATM